jgi:DNA-binding NarL/FixJ family response regulator
VNGYLSSSNQRKAIMTMIRVIILDDHDLVRQGIRSLLDDYPDVTIVAEGWAGEHLSPLVAEHKPD